MSNPHSDPFLTHLTVVLSAYEAGRDASAVPPYDGPANEQTHSVLRSLDVIASRMQTAEDKLRPIGVDIDTSLPVSGSRTNRGGAPERSTTQSVDRTVRAPPSVGSERGLDAEQEVRSLRTQVRDAARVCDAVARGDLSQRVRASSANADEAPLQTSVNAMVDVLGRGTTEMLDIVRNYGEPQCCHGPSDAFPPHEGVWADVLRALLRLEGDVTNTIRSACEVLKAVAFGDLSRTMTIDLHHGGELLDFKCTVNGMVAELRTRIASTSEDASQAGAGF